MKPVTFVEEIRAVVIEDEKEICRKTFLSTRSEDATDPHWRRALELFSRLGDPDKEVLFDIIRQAQVDAVAHFLGVLDGVSDFPEELSLTDEEGNQINGDLQDLFIALEYQ